MLKHLKNEASWNEKGLAAKGFTLIELLVVIIILGILAGVAIFAINGLDDTAHKNSCINEKDTVELAVEAYRTNNPGTDPSTADLMTDATPGGNLKKTPKYWAANAGVVERLPSSISLVNATECP